MQVRATARFGGMLALATALVMSALPAMILPMNAAGHTCCIGPEHCPPPAATITCCQTPRPAPPATSAPDSDRPANHSGSLDRSLSVPVVVHAPDLVFARAVYGARLKSPPDPAYLLNSSFLI